MKELGYIKKKRHLLFDVLRQCPHPEGNRLVYATSSQPLGPWTYRGVILEGTGSGTSHGSIVEIQRREWFLFLSQQRPFGEKTEYVPFIVSKQHYR